MLGKLPEVEDAIDRYANFEIAYPLERMELHEGVVVLATNLAKRINETFPRLLLLPDPEDHKLSGLSGAKPTSKITFPLSMSF